MMRVGVFVLFAVLPLAGQEFKLPASLDKLAEKAVESVSVTLDEKTLQLAAQFLSSKKADESGIKSLVAGLKSVTVRSFEFDKPGQYTMAELDAVRQQLHAPDWSKIVSVSSKQDGEKTEIYIKSGGDGIVILAAEAKELTIVNIIGNIDLSRLSELGGQFGIPKLPAEKDKAKKKD
jgi:hypothetical protein